VPATLEFQITLTPTFPLPFQTISIVWVSNPLTLPIISCDAMSYVVGQIFGGFGNQLFQYAAAQSVAMKTGRRPIFWHAGHLTPERPYALSRLVASEQLLTDPQNRLLQWYVEPKGARVARTLAALLRLPCRVNWLIDKQQGYDPRIDSIPGLLVLWGFWQSERYFSQIGQTIAGSIRRAFQIEPLAQRETSVCVHVRRGDYVGNAHLALTPMDYFERAISYMRSKLTAPRFTVFSDDPRWCREQFRQFGDVTVPDNSGRQEDQFSEFSQMSACDHFIISNSSFSWWAAWLGTCPDKIVVTPTRWFLPGAKAQFHPGLDSWVRM